MVDFFTGFGEPTGLRAVAGSMNLRLCPDELDRQYWVDNPGGLPPMPLFNHGETKAVVDMMYGQFGGLPLQAFDFRAIAYPDDPGNDERSCVLFSMTSNFATLTVGPHTRLSRLQERTKNPFTQRFRVQGRDEEVADLVLDEPMQKWLLTVDDRLRLEISGAALLAHVPRLEPSEYPLLLQQTYGIYLRIPDKAWQRYGTGAPF
jgi:hypothetical protein